MIERLFISFIMMLQVFGSILPGVGHHHNTLVLKDTRPAFAVHGCGNQERHIPLEDLQRCAICQQSTQRHATLPEPVISLIVPPPALFAATSPDERVRNTPLLTADTRGPPDA